MKVYIWDGAEEYSFYYLMHWVEDGKVKYSIRFDGGIKVGVLCSDVNLENGWSAFAVAS